MHVYTQTYLIYIYTHPQTYTYTRALTTEAISPAQPGARLSPGSINRSLNSYPMNTRAPGPASVRSRDGCMRNLSPMPCLLSTLCVPGPTWDTMTSETNNSGPQDPRTHEHNKLFLVLGT